MSNNQNTILAEQLQDLKEEEADTKLNFEQDKANFEILRKDLQASELKWLNAKVALYEFERHTNND